MSGKYAGPTTLRKRLAALTAVTPTGRVCQSNIRQELGYPPSKGWTGLGRYICRTGVAVSDKSQNEPLSSVNVPTASPSDQDGHVADMPDCPDIPSREDASRALRPTSSAFQPSERSMPGGSPFLLLAYWLLLLYASLMPFDLRFERTDVGNNFSRAWDYWPIGCRRVPRSDLVSNVILYIPLGMLSALSWSRRARPEAWKAFISPTVFVLATSVLVESLQLLSARRVANVTDTLMNVTGGAIGVALGMRWGRRLWDQLRRGLRARWLCRPESLLPTAMMVLLAADALYPYLPTVDVSQVVRGLRASHLSPLEGLRVHPWHHWVVERVSMYGALTVVLACSSSRKGFAHNLHTALVVVVFAAAIELTKPFIMSRYMNVANVMMSGLGALVGLALGRLAGQRVSRSARISVAILALACYMVYLEWRPFEFRWDRSAMAEKMPSGVEWLPLYHYAVSGLPKDVFLFVRTIALMAGIVFGLGLLGMPFSRTSRWRCFVLAAGVAGLFGTSLEMVQFAIPGRHPSVTDIFCFAVGGIAGSALLRHWWRREMPG